jgi:hypothetical protein
MQASQRSARLAALTFAIAAWALPARAETDWTAVREAWQVRIVTADEDGSVRDVPVWAVVPDGDAAYVRTNASRWLANIRRGSDVRLRVRDTEIPVAPTEVEDEATKARVEQAYRDKYGLLQRVMSALRMREPTVLKLAAR